MRSLLRSFALAAFIVPAAAGIMMTASPAEAAPAKAKAAEQTLQADIIRLTNEQRAAHGCAGLTENAQLTDAARGHSAWMGQTGAFSHTGRGGSDFVVRSKAAGYASPSAENIAWGYRSAADVVGAWMRSPGHRANILNCKSKTVGVGAVYSANGAPYYTQDFGY
ncbi:CAP domain-containing protein [Actinoplanes oblitus]|uniref:CAP domain-containing protein n=1 Tax=Actinoplanes oblitus TaxID=3040509 RepID=A0ABY8WAK1_9ACTN|nr:CAP domain-containing protein [Actinoplanes oblitus]WIM92745.1 CAP domain-containing protein [Actinoplanes oblitus]